MALEAIDPPREPPWQAHVLLIDSAIGAGLCPTCGARLIQRWTTFYCWQDHFLADVVPCILASILAQPQA